MRILLNPTRKEKMKENLDKLKHIMDNSKFTRSHIERVGNNIYAVITLNR